MFRARNWGVGAARTAAYVWSQTLGQDGETLRVLVHDSAYPVQAAPDFPTLGSLEEFLSVHGVNVKAWGTPQLPQSKPVSQLYEELGNGETVLGVENEKVLRIVQVVQVEIANGKNQELREMQQSGVVKRKRGGDGQGALLSEKIKTWQGETYDHAAIRGCCEELQVHPNQVQLDRMQQASRVLTSENASTSYPGLASRYLIFKVKARVGGLPEDRFVRTESGGLTTHWAWRTPLPAAEQPPQPPPAPPLAFVDVFLEHRPGDERQLVICGHSPARLQFALAEMFDKMLGCSAVDSMEELKVWLSEHKG
jgi:hypothetical protein